MFSAAKNWDPALKYLNTIALNLTPVAALLRGVESGREREGEVGVEILGAQTKQIRTRYWREGAFSIQPLCSLIKSFISAFLQYS